MTDTEYLKELGKRIRVASQARGLTIKQLANLCEMDSSGLWGIQVGRKAPKITTLRKIAKTLEIDLKELV